jgi:mannose-6-phosphate isomerase class I
LVVGPTTSRRATANGAEIIVCIEGSAAVSAGGETVDLPRGAAVLVPHGIEYKIASRDGSGVVFKAATPVM